MKHFFKRWLPKKSQTIDSSQQLDNLLRNGLSATSTGLHVTTDSALKVSAVFACVRVLSESVAQLPLIVYRRLPEGGKQRATDHPLFSLLHRSPNAWQTSFEWRECLQAHLALRGNAYALITRLGRGEVRELLPIHPDRVQVEQGDDFSLRYTITLETGEQRVVNPQQLLHLRGLSLNGITGLSPISLHREGIGLAMATERHGAKLFGNGTTVSGVLQHPNHLSDSAHQHLKQSLKDEFSGVDNAFKTLILEEGMNWQAIGMSNEDAQFLQTRKFQVTDIARLYRIPPHMIGDLEKATFSNIVEQSLEFVLYTLTPWLTRWEQALTRTLLTNEEQQEYFIEFNVDGLLRGDIEKRYGAYATARQWGWMNVDEIRSMENMNPLPDNLGQEYLRPLNMVNVNEDTESSDER